MLNHKTKHKIKMLYSEKNKISVISEVLGIDCQEIEQFLQEEKLLPKRVKDTDKVEMNKMAKAGLSISSIARHFDVSYITANRLLYEPGEIIQTEPGKNFLKLFDKYSKIFKEKMFSIGNKNYKIAKCRVDIAEDNLEKLKTIFDRTFKAMKGGLYELHENKF